MKEKIVKINFQTVSDKVGTLQEKAPQDEKLHLQEVKKSVKDYQSDEF